MKTQRLLIVLTLVNVGLFVGTLAQTYPVAAQNAPAPGVLRGTAVEIVDRQGRVRASLGVLPAGRSDAGDRYPETVLLRLITERGRPAVKISASEEGSGLIFAGPSGTKDAWLTLGVTGTESVLRLRNENGREQVVKP